MRVASCYCESFIMLEYCKVSLGTNDLKGQKKWPWGTKKGIHCVLFVGDDVGLYLQHPEQNASIRQFFTLVWLLAEKTTISCYLCVHVLWKLILLFLPSRGGAYFSTLWIGTWPQVSRKSYTNRIFNRFCFDLVLFASPSPPNFK